MAQVVLFRPKEWYSQALSCIRAPLGLLYLAAALRDAGISVALIDTDTTDDWQHAVSDAVGPETVLAGVGTMTGYQIGGALEFARYVRGLTDARIVWGGLHPSLMPEQTLAHEKVDVIVIGEAEQTLVSLVRCLQSDGDLADVPGICFMRDGQILRTPTPDFIDMDTLAQPAYDLVDVEHYASIAGKVVKDFRRCLEVNTDRGCPRRCAFCYNTSFNRRRWRAMSAAKVLDHTETLVHRYNLDSVNFVADNFCVDPRRVRDICQGLIDRDLHILWHTDMRIDTFLRFDDDILELMKR
ncbi:hypothetical protein LCGC14_2776520, partial [marine sediment metagenome]